VERKHLYEVSRVVEKDQDQPEQAASCGCFTEPNLFLENDRELGMDGSFAEVSLLTCSVCGQQWLRYFYEVEAFTASGRWYLGAITEEQVALLTDENAKAALENLDWYFYGGSYYRGKSGRTSGSLSLNP
jgi:hypothetical protein